MAERRAPSGRPYFFLLAVVCVAAAAYWLYDDYFRASALPVRMTSPDFALSDLDGQTVTQAQFDGKVRVMSFIYTRCPDICPATTANMVLLQKQLQEEGLYGKEVAFVSVTFDPANDTPDVLRQYADRMGVDRSGWTLLRGAEEEVQALAEGYKFSIVRLDDGLYAHPVTSLLLIDGKQRVRNIYRMGEEMDNDVIRSDIETLVDELRRDA